MGISDSPTGSLLKDENGDTVSMWTLVTRITDRYGVVAIIAMFLVWMLSNAVAQDLRSVSSKLDSHIDEQRFYLRAICLNTAQDDAARAQCFPPRVSRLAE